MVINKVLDEVFSTWSNIAVFRVLKKHVIGISGREVARLAGMSPKNCLITLSALENLGMVNRVRGGRDHFFSLNREHIIVEEVVLPALKAEDEFFNKLAVLLKNKLKNKTVSMIVYGSVARKEETIESDLDLCVVLKNISQKPEAEEILFDLTSTVKQKYGVSISPIYFTRKEFSLWAGKSKAPVNNIIEEGMVISGLSIKELINDKKIKRSYS